jgi:hypothetical protein
MLYAQKTVTFLADQLFLKLPDRPYSKLPVTP